MNAYLFRDPRTFRFIVCLCSLSFALLAGCASNDRSVVVAVDDRALVQQRVQQPARLGQRARGEEQPGTLHGVHEVPCVAPERRDELVE